mgnify:FL=1
MEECTCNCSCADELTKELDKIIAAYRNQPGGLIQVLTKAQQLVGYLPRWVQVRVAEGLGLSLQEVYGVCSFYTFFSLIPKGRHKISICAGTACYVKGSQTIVKTLHELLGIKPGQTTADSRFTVELVRCIGACGLAPAVIIDDQDVHGRLTPELMPAILEQYQ